MKIFTRRIMAITLSLALVFASGIFFSAKTKADVQQLTITSALESGNEHQLHVTWTNPSEVVAGEGYTFGYYIDSIGNDNQAKAANGWVWSRDNPTEIRTMLDTVCGTNGGVDFKNGGDYTVIVVIYKDGAIYAQGTSNSVYIDPDESHNFDASFKLDRYEPHEGGPTNTVVSWQPISGVKSYSLMNKDTGEVFVNVGENATWTQWNAPTSTTPNDTYTCQIVAKDANGDPIDITNDEITLNYDLELPPAEHTDADFSGATWDELETKGSDASTITKDYYINSTHGLNTYFWGIYAPDEDIPYHEQRDQCIIDTPVFSFQWSNITSVWINSVKYKNHTTTFNNQGDCGEISINAFHSGINVITLVMNDGSYKTYGIKVEGGVTHSVTIDGTKVADVDDGDTYTFPTQGMTEYTEYGYYLTNDSSKAYAPGDQITVEDDLAFTGIDTMSVVTGTGANIRMVKDNPGISFKTTVSINGNSPILSSSFTYGAVITTYDSYIYKYDENLVIDNSEDQANVVLSSEGDWFDYQEGVFRAGIMKIKPYNIARDFVCRGYVKINYVSGASKVVYADNPNTPSRVRSVSQVAANIKNTPSYYNTLSVSEKEAIDYFAEQ